MTQRGSTIRIFLADGEPHGLRLASKSNWAGQAIVASRTDYKELRKRTEWLASPGVYILVDHSDYGSKPRVYIGQADDLISRLDQHFKEKDFWTQVVVCNVSNHSLNNAHIRRLEANLIRLANDSGLAIMENANRGTPVKLSEADEQDVETYLEELLVLLPVLGLRFFDVIDKPIADHPPDPTPAGTELFLEYQNAKGVGYDRADGFVVSKGAVARTKTTSSAGKGIIKLRQELLAEGALVPDGPRLHLTRSVRFHSPSQAAAVLLGRSASGRTDWKDASGRTLGQIQQDEVDAEAKPSAISSS